MEASLSKMKLTYAFDLDGTITREPVQIGEIMLGLRQRGHRVVVLTCVEGGEKNRQNRLDMLAKSKVDSTFYDDLVVVETATQKGEWARDNAAVMMFDDNEGVLLEMKRIYPPLTGWWIR